MASLLKPFDKQPIFFLILGLVCIIIGVISIGLNSSVYGTVPHFRPGAWWSSMFVAFSGFSSCACKNRGVLMITCIFSVFSVILTFIGTVTDGLSAEFVGTLETCYDPQQDKMYGGNEFSTAATECYKKSTVSDAQCYCTDSSKDCFVFNDQTSCGSIVANSYLMQLQACVVFDVFCLISVIILAGGSLFALFNPLRMDQLDFLAEYYAWTENNSNSGEDGETCELNLRNTDKPRIIETDIVEDIEFVSGRGLLQQDSNEMNNFNNQNEFNYSYSNSNELVDHNDHVHINMNRFDYPMTRNDGDMDMDLEGGEENDRSHSSIHHHHHHRRNNQTNHSDISDDERNSRNSIHSNDSNNSHNIHSYRTNNLQGSIRGDREVVKFGNGDESWRVDSDRL